MSPTSLARVIVTVNYQLTLLHVGMLITQLGARALPTERSVAVVGNWRTLGTFLVMWRVSSASQITLSLLEHASIQ